ncbi:TonB-dependent siderophore receptor [Janthinobacterium aquaticum]|nr:TonB-dependent siderophore receptor [Janthinobacterium sp. FT58W]
MQMSPPRISLAPLALAVAMALGASPLAMAQVAASQEATLDVAIGAQPLAQALSELARKSGVTLLATPVLLAGKEGHAVTGRLTVRQAFDRLLLGSGLQANIDGNAVTIVAAQRLVAQEATMAPVLVTARADAATENSGSYAARQLTIGKGAQSLRETPQSVTVVTRQRMDDQNMLTLADVLLQSTGVTAQERNFGHFTYNARGFGISNFQVDGVPRGDYGGIGIAPDLAIFDRVEVLRGAPGVLVGNGDPSGTVNFVRKRPTAEKQINLTARAGRWSNYRFDVDASGPLNDSGSIRGRVVAAYEQRQSWVRQTEIDAPLLYGIIEADLGSDTMLTAGARTQSYHQDGGRWIGGLPQSTDGSDLHLPRSTSMAPSWTSLDVKGHELFAELSHRFSDDWQFKLSSSYLKSERQDKATRRAGYVNPQTLTGVSINSVVYGDDQYEDAGVDGQLSGKFTALGRQHSVIVGANWQRNEIDSRDVRVSFSPAYPVDFNRFTTAAVAEPARPAWGPAIYSRTVTQGVYGNVKLSLSEPLSLILGGRVSWYDYQDVDRGTGQVGSAYKQSREFTPFVAALYRLDARWSLYGSYTDIFTPQSSRYTSSGKPLSPSIGKNYEAGLKGELFDGRLNASAAVFHTVQDGLAATDPQFPLNCPGTPATGGCSLNGGKVKSEGFETELSGEVLKNLQVSAGYTFNAARYVINRDENGLPTPYEGQPYGHDYNPRHMLRLWSSYKPEALLAGLTLGGGVSLQSETSDLDLYAPAGPSLRQQSGYAVWSAMAGYRISPHWQASLNVANLFDKRYYQGAYQGWYGAPRHVTLTLRGQF